VDIVGLLKRLSEAHGVSGYEHGIRQVVLESFGHLADQTHVDTLGNVVALKQGAGPEPRLAVMLAAHMDEIGLIVRELEDGFIHFWQIGGYDDRVLPGQEVVVHGRRQLTGVIGAPPPHVLPRADRNKPFPADKLLVDVGLPPEEVSRLVRVGDLITMKCDLLELHGGLVAGKAFDNRASVAAVAVCLEELSRLHHSWDVYAVATVQEEVTYGGAITATFGIKPQIGIALDVTFARQPGVPEDATFELGKGPTINYGPNFHPKLSDSLVEAAKSLELPWQMEASPRPGGTDAYAIQISREGIPAGLVSIPLRNMHTPVETGSVKDIERAGRLVATFISRLDENSLANLAWDLGLD
jgi:tetrahedral aminopeptidase